MYYSVGFYPQLSAELAESIDDIRKAYDPSWRLIEPHIGICFPATNSLDIELLSRHVERVVSSWSPFIVRLGGFYKSRDHWLFITLEEGADEVKRLYREMYTGYLAKYLREGHDPVPHIGLGLFIKEGCLYDWRNPRDSDFDKERYEEALVRVQALPLPSSVLMDRVYITMIPEAVPEFTTGKRADLPDDAEMKAVREFRLGNLDA